MEGPSMACHSLGTINSLVDKITQITKRHPKVKILLQDLEILRKDYMNKFVRGGATGEQVRVWMKQVREMVYDIEDWVDTRQLEPADFGESDELQIKEFKDQIEDALDRCGRYELLNQVPAADDCARSSDVSVVDRPLLWERKLLVGISGPKSELLRHLGNEQEELKVVSILGAAGQGKTTLAKEIYGDIKTQFECHAFVSVGRTTSPRTTLVEILRQIKSEADTRDASSCNVKQVDEVVTELWGLLRTKRYFICIDDMRCPMASKVVNCALPDNNLGSRILTATRIKNIAVSCPRSPRDVVYEMNALSEDDSKSLFVNSAYVQQVKWPDHSNEFLKKLLELCGGTPLAIIITAGLLLGKASAELSALSTMLNETMLPEAQAMKKILGICYSNLPLPLKSCFLYLSAFSGNHINKGHLIRRWAAEALITERHGKSLWEIGESYFNELIIRGLIQPEFDDDDDQPIGCAVDGAAFDFIESMSAEENFITMGAELKAGLFPCDRLRRVCLDCSGEDEGDTSGAYPFLEQNGWVISNSDEDEASNLSSDEDEASNLRHLSAVRSFAFSGDSRSMPCLTALKVIRVLDLEDTKGLTYHQLKSIELLSLLRYLGLGGTNVTQLPQQIMALKHLITLDLRRTEVRELPAFGGKKLVYLLTPGLTVPRGMGGMEELEELSEVFLGRDVLLNRDSHADNVARLVNKSRRLRKLGVKFGYIEQTERQSVKYFLEEVAKSNLQSLSLDDYPCDSVALLVECWADKRPHNLRKFELRIYYCFPLVPAEMASIKALTHLHIQVKAVEAQDVRALGILPNLILLKLFSEEGTQERLSINSEDGFRSLKVFWFRSSYFHGMELQFKEGAMPHLLRLQIEFNARKTKFFYGSYDFGIQHLSSLLRLSAIIRCKDATDSEGKAAEAAIRDQVSQIPYNPLPMHVDDVLLRKEANIEANNSTTSTMDIKISILPESSSRLPLPGVISFVMEDAMVSSSTGAMNSILTKLAALMGEQYAKLTGTDKQELRLRDELLVMNALLKQLSHTPGLNLQMKECRKQMRELTYDIDDSIDDLMLLSSVDEGGSGSTEKRVMPHDFTDRIQKLNARVEKAGLPSAARKAEMRTFGPRRHMPGEQWLSILDEEGAFKPVERDQPSVESMRKIYGDLSSDMKTCLLYLSSFPANQVVRKDRLIRRWAAEGFLSKRSLEDWWQTGESYILELIVRKLLEPVYGGKEDVLPTGCKVGDSVHHFITSLSNEENFVKAGPHGVFWRFYDSPYSYEPAQDRIGVFIQMKYSKVRSLTIHTDFSYPWWMHDLWSAFKHVRVLDLEDIKGLHQGELRNVGRLSLLRYLGLGCSGLSSLPQEVIALEHLETVDLRGSSRLQELPAFKSTKLVSLIADDIRLPRETAELSRVLEELSTVLVGGDGSRLARVVQESKRLRRLGVTISYDESVSAQGREALTDLLGAIANSNILSLCLDDRFGDGSVLLDSLLSCWAQQRPRHLQKLLLQLGILGILLEVPRKLSPSLTYLTHLNIIVERVNTEGLCILGNLPNLVVLSLGCQPRYRHPKHTTKKSIISSIGFRCLRVFSYSVGSNGSMDLQFGAGAMPQLRRLGLRFFAKETESEHGGVDSGIHRLTCLVRVHAIINCLFSTAASVEAVEAAMRSQVSQNPNNPVLEITREGEPMMVKDRKNPKFPY